MRRQGIVAIVLVWAAAPVCAQDSETLQQENASLRRQLREMEARNRQLQVDLDEARAAVVQAKLQADAFEHRCKRLQDVLATLRNPKADNGIANTDIPSATKIKSTIAQGKITAIGKDGRLLQISLGFEAGVKEGQTLEVFRLGNQRPLYLGTVTLTRVDPQVSLGQFKNLPGVEQRPALGDEVASELIVK